MTMQNIAPRSGEAGTDTALWGLRLMPSPATDWQKISVIGPHGRILVARSRAGAEWQVIAPESMRLLTSTADRDLAIAAACGAARLNFTAAPWVRDDLEEIGVPEHARRKILLYCATNIESASLTQ
jgi:hypothetical protein